MRIFSSLSTWPFQSVFARLNPQDCALCGIAAPTIICADCEHGLPYSAGPMCLRCAIELPNHIGHIGAPVLCGACVTDLPHFDHTITAFRYEFPLDRLLLAYKFRANLVFTTLLANALTEKIIAACANTPLPDLIMPTPLATQRLAERGFNQSALLGRTVAKRLGVKFLANGLQRVRETRPQTGLKRDERLQNVRGAFVCTVDVTNKRIAIVDDVMTTGATQSEIAKALKKSGAAYVQSWAVARAQQH